MSELERVVNELRRRMDNWQRIQATLPADDLIAQADAAARIATFAECLSVILPMAGARYGPPPVP
jgi:hypothetical protein